METEVPLVEEGGTFAVPVSINDTIVLRFTIDSGAADVSIPADVVSTLVRSGTITREDFIGSQTFVLADGTQVPSAEFRIRTLKVGTLVLHDVVGSLSDAKGTLLLGQSFLSRLSSWSIDNSQHLLKLKAAPGQAELSESAAVDASGTDDSEALLQPDDVRDVAADFHRTMKQTGMSGVAARVQDCYQSLEADDGAEVRKNAAYCVTLDLVAQGIDASFRKQFEKQTGRLPPAIDYYEDGVWQARLQKYLPLTTPTHEMPPAKAVLASVQATEKAVLERMNRQQAQR